MPSSWCRNSSRAAFLLGPHCVLSYRLSEIQLTAFVVIHWFRRSQRNFRSFASLFLAAIASIRTLRSRRCFPREGLQRYHRFSSQISSLARSSGSSPNMAVKPYRIGSQFSSSRSRSSRSASARSSSAACLSERTLRASPPSSWMRRSCLASRIATAFACISQPMELRSGSSPAVVSTIHTGWLRLAPASPVMMSHKSRFGWACSSSKMTQLGL